MKENEKYEKVQKTDIPTTDQNTNGDENKPSDDIKIVTEANANEKKDISAELIKVSEHITDLKTEVAIETLVTADTEVINQYFEEIVEVKPVNSENMATSEDLIKLNKQEDLLPVEEANDVQEVTVAEIGSDSNQIPKNQ